MIRSALSSEWTLEALHDPEGRVQGSYPAAIPGCVHTDLMASGVIGDPYLDAGESELTWMYALDWRYQRPLADEAADPGDRIELVFDGIDTIATVRLGDTELGRTANMHRSYRFDVTSLVGPTPQQLQVDLTSATTHGEAERARLGDRPSPYGTPFPFLRKMACSFGWDWGPDLRTAGLWRGVRLERWHTARLGSVRPLVRLLEDGTGQVELIVDLAWAEPTAVVLSAEALGHQVTASIPAGQASASLVLELPDVPVWWPVGYGDHPLVDLIVTLEAGDGEKLDEWRRAVGFRNVELDTAPDEHGSAFLFKINGKPIFVKGANWIPDDHFVSRITADRIDRRLDQAVEANLNLLRIWGGGIYESEEFYRGCDDRGLLVWQDFLLACAAYPEDEPLASEFEAEARENVVRLMPHPSLIHWNGGNENLWGHEDWRWKDALAGKSWGERYARELFPAIVAELDPTRTYSDNSPCSPGYGPAEMHPNDPDHGSHHQWEVWNRRDYLEYRDEIPRFCSEFGFQGPPAWRTLTEGVRAVDGGPLDAAASPKDDPNFLLHQKAADGNGKLDRGLAPHLGIPADFVDWHWATQLNQAHAVAFAVDHYRRWWPRTAGAIVWQINDCWPVTSWAAVDSAERLKPLWYAMRDAFAPRRVVFDGERVDVLNDTDEPWIGQLVVTREHLDGAVLAELRIDLGVEPRSTALVRTDTAERAADDPASEVMVARFGEASAVHAFVADADLDLRPDPVRVDVAETDDGYAVTLTAHTLAKDLTLQVDRVAADAVVDRGLVTLRAGEQAVFQVRTAAVGVADQLGQAPVLRSANDLRQVSKVQL